MLLAADYTAKLLLSMGIAAPEVLFHSNACLHSFRCTARSGSLLSSRSRQRGPVGTSGKQSGSRPWSREIRLVALNNADSLDKPSNVNNHTNDVVSREHKKHNYGIHYQ